MNARYASVSPISPPISDIRYEKHQSDTIPYLEPCIITHYDDTNAKVLTYNTIIMILQKK